MQIKKRNHSSVTASKRMPVLAADDDMMVDDYDDTEGLNDAIDDVADTLDDMQEDIDDIDEDTASIEIENNIANHFIAECDGCQGIFISAVIQSDQEIDHISGICPICGKKTDQYLKWVIKDVDESDEVEIEEEQGSVIEEPNPDEVEPVTNPEDQTFDELGGE